MFRIPIKIIYQGEWPEEERLFNTALADEAVVRREGVSIVTDMLALAPAHDIAAEYKVTTEIQHYEAEGVKFWELCRSWVSVSECTVTVILNADEVCWKLWEQKNA